MWFALQGVTPANEQVAVLVFDADTKLGVAYYTFPTGVHVIEHVERGASGGDVVIYAAPNTGAQANACWVWGDTRNATDLSWNGATFVEAAINCLFIDAPKFVTPDTETVVNRLDLDTAVDAIGTVTVAFKVQFLSSQYVTSAQALAALTQNVAAAGVYTEAHKAYGVSTVCRWFRPVVTWTFGSATALGYGAGIKALRAQGYPTARAPALV